ncbi:MAG: glycosyltransferase family 2 protein [Gemmatimonadota bacterium]|nr:MAG: glycosyltransferase family 2 protein [Gemmatimonadota bacterium]
MSQAAATPSRQPAEARVGSALARDFSVIIPALNESENIAELFGELDATFREYDLDGEIIFVDDGSTDDSLEVARREGAKLRRFRLESHARNLGKTEALVTGARAAATDWLVLFDADLQHHPGEIPRLLAEVEKGYDIVCGRKVGKYQKPVVSGIYNWLSRRVFDVPARDLNSIKIFRKAVLEDIQMRHDWHRFFVVIAHVQGYRVGEIDVTLYPRRKGVSKYGGTGRVFVGLLDLVAVWFLLLFSRKPMLLFGFTGLVLVGLGLVVGVVAIVMRLMGQGFRPMLDLVVLLGIMGASLFGFGLVAEMVAALRADVDELRDSIRRLRDREGREQRGDD